MILLTVKAFCLEFGSFRFTIEYKRLVVEPFCLIIEPFCLKFEPKRLVLLFNS